MGLSLLANMEATTNLHAIFSNAPRQLLLGLKSRLLHPSRGPFEPFSLIVPSPLVKEWIYRELARDPEVQIATGMQFSTAHTFFSRLYASKTPHLLELALTAYKHISETSHPFPENSRGELALEMARLLLEYGELPLPVLFKWKCAASPSLLQSFSQKLTCKLPCEKLDKLTFPSEGEIHFFGIDYFTPVQLQILQKLGEKLPVYLWMFSPTRMFLGDLKGGKEKERLLAKVAGRPHAGEWETLLESNFDFLGHHAKLLRQAFNAIEDLSITREEIFEAASWTVHNPHYNHIMLDGVVPSPVPSSPCLLQAFQADLLLQREPGEDKIQFPHDDASLQIHAAPDPEREVEALYEILETLVADEKILPHEIWVGVSNLSSYAPYIEKVFLDPTRALKGEIVAPKPWIETPYAKLLLRLLQFGKSRWKIEDLFDLLEDPLFKSNFKPGEARDLKTRFLHCGATWGLAPAHRQKIAPEGNWEERGTLKDTIRKLLLNIGTKFTCEEFLQEKGCEPCFDPFPLTLTEAFNEFIEVTEKLQEDLLPLLDDPKCTLSEWNALLQKIVEKYLKPDAEFEQELKAWNKLYEELSSDLTDLALPFPTFLLFWRHFLSSRESSRPSLDLSKIKFTAIVPLKTATYQVIALLGMNQGEFPTVPRHLPILNPRPEGYSPERSDFERAAFLASLHLAKKHWIASYHEQGIGPSESLLDLMKSLDERFLVGDRPPSEKIVYRHPSLPFDLPYFLPDSPLPNRSQRSYQLALLPRKNKCGGFSPLSEEPGRPSATPPSVLSLKDLKNAFFHPLRHYLNKQLGLYLKNKFQAEGAFEEFEEKGGSSHEWLIWTLKYPIERVIQLAKAVKSFPTPPFRELSIERFRLKLAEQLALFQNASIDPSAVFEVEWVAHLPSPQKVSPSKWEFPAPTILYQGRPLQIIGQIPFVSEKGLLLLKEPSAKDLLPSLPEIKLFHDASYGHFAKEVHFLKAGEKKTSALPLSWEELLDHYFQILNEPVPLHPSWVESIAEGSEEKLKTKLQEAWGNDPLHHDPYVEWAFASKHLHDFSRLISLWQEPAKKLTASLRSAFDL